MCERMHVKCGVSACGVSACVCNMHMYVSRLCVEGDVKPEKADTMIRPTIDSTLPNTTMQVMKTYECVTCLSI